MTSKKTVLKPVLSLKGANIGSRFFKKSWGGCGGDKTCIVLQKPVFSRKVEIFEVQAFAK